MSDYSGVRISRPFNAGGNGSRRQVVFEWAKCSTNPKVHREGSFQYLIHAIRSSKAAQGSAFMRNSAMRDNCFRPEPDIANGPDNIQTSLRKKLSGRVICCSLIDSTHRSLWAYQGLILEIRPDLVLATSEHDLGTPAYSLTETKDRFLHQKIISPKELLERSYLTSHNEVVISGEESQAVKVLGVIVALDALGKTRDCYGETLMHKAQKEGLPIVSFNPILFTGDRNNNVCVYGKDATLREVESRSIKPEQKSDIYAISYYDQETGTKYQLSLYIREDYFVDRKESVLVIELSPCGDTDDKYFVVASDNGFNYEDKQYIKYWDDQKLEISRGVLARLRERMPEIFTPDIQVQGQRRLSDLFDLAVKLINNPSRCRIVR